MRCRISSSARTRRCEGLPETHEVIKFLRAKLDAHFPDRMLLAEANQPPELVRSYFGDGDEFHMAFHFPLMTRMFMAVRLEDRKPLVDVIERTPEIPETCQWGIFLRNHDELTLEMVTDVERAYMIDEYARDPASRIYLGIRRRLAPLLDGDRRRIELMNGILMSMPGSPIIYYGDEIGMGDNIYLGDRNGVRTPMQWNGGWNAGFSTADPERLAQPLISNPALRLPGGERRIAEASRSLAAQLDAPADRRAAVVARLQPRGHDVPQAGESPRARLSANARQGAGARVSATSSSSAQAVELDLQSLAGALPIEMFGRSLFPRIGELPYMLTLGPYAFFWFKLRRF